MLFSFSFSLPKLGYLFNPEEISNAPNVNNLSGIFSCDYNMKNSIARYWLKGTKNLERSFFT